MTEPARLLNTAESELERALLDAGRTYSASSSTRTKTLLALGLTSVTTSVPPSAARNSLAKATLSKLAIALVAVGAAAVPVWRYLHRQVNSTTVALVPATSSAGVLPVPSAASGPLGVEPSFAEPAREPVLEPQSPASNASAGASTSRSEARAPAAPPLAAELAALDAARTSLSRSDPNAALVALDGYTRTFPHGKLRLEAEVLRIGALAKSGQAEAARKRAEAFLRRHPDSVLAARVRSYAGL